MKEKDGPTTFPSEHFFFFLFCYFRVIFHNQRCQDVWAD